MTRVSFYETNSAVLGSMYAGLRPRTLGAAPRRVAAIRMKSPARDCVCPSRFHSNVAEDSAWTWSDSRAGFRRALETARAFYFKEEMNG